MPELHELVARLVPDPDRQQLGWEPAFKEAQDALLAATTPDDRARVLAGWLGVHQPCLFGRMAAKQGLLEFCLLTAEDLAMGDLHVRDTIQDSRRAWKAAGMAGEKHGFIVGIIDPTVANAKPDASLLAVAIRLAELYLLREEIKVDEIWMDQISLEAPGLPQNHQFQWDAGVNVFAAAGDRRWWQDHRVPGGLVFSVNSVGHMAKSTVVREKSREFAKGVGAKADIEGYEKVANLGDALRFAMQTIQGASEAVSGKATWLLSADTMGDNPPECPFKKPKVIENTNHCRYQGYYHTDQTVPSLYFDGAVTRPVSVQPVELDFTYLFVRAASNPAFETMGTGVQVRASDEASDGPAQKGRDRRFTAIERIVRKDDAEKS